MSNVFSDLDRIELRGLQATGFHGVFDFERNQGQMFVVDVVIGVSNMRKSAKADDVSKTVNYAEVAQLVQSEITGEPVNLIETLADRIASRVLDLSHVKAVQVTVHKPNAPIVMPDQSPVDFRDVSVIVTRTA